MWFGLFFLSVLFGHIVAFVVTPLVRPFSKSKDAELYDLVVAFSAFLVVSAVFWIPVFWFNSGPLLLRFSPWISMGVVALVVFLLVLVRLWIERREHGLIEFCRSSFGYEFLEASREQDDYFSDAVTNLLKYEPAVEE